MATPDQARAALIAVTDAAVTAGSTLLAGSTDTRAARNDLLDALPALIETYSDGTAALAADYYDDVRDTAGAHGSYLAEPVVNLRPEKIRIGGLWTIKPLLLPEPDIGAAQERLAEVIQLETARPFRDTITTNSHRDPASVGWRRITHGGCDLCRFLAARGAVYRQDTANFATHPHCRCGAVPVFDGQDGDEASALQYVASDRRAGRTRKQRDAINEALAQFRETGTL